MSARSRTLALAFAALSSVVMVAPLKAQVSDMAGTLYSEGVDAFFAGQSDQAVASLSRSIGANPNDPRAFYFRALARLRAGDSDGARADMKAGAEVESRLPNRYAIGKALERVQGYDRLELEKYRRTARMNVVTTAKPIVPVSGQQPLAEPDAAVLRDRRMVPLDEFIQPGTPKLVPVPEAVQATATTGPAPVTNSAVPAAANEPDPFVDDAAKAKAAPAKAAAATVDAAAGATAVTPAKADASATAPAAAGSEPDPFEEAASKSQSAAPAKVPPQGTATPKKAAPKTDAPLSGKVDKSKAAAPAKAETPKLPPQSKDAGDGGNPFNL
jgi:hypothetical protein